MITDMRSFAESFRPLQAVKQKFINHFVSFLSRLLTIPLLAFLA